MAPTDYADRLALALQEQGMTPVELAALLGVKRQAIEKLLRGDSKSLNSKNNSLAAATLKVDPDWLATGKGQMRASLPNRPPLHEALPVVLDALTQSEDWNELKQVVPLLIETNSENYRKQIAQLLKVDPRYVVWDGAERRSGTDRRGNAPLGQE